MNIHKIESIINLIQLGLTSGKAIYDAAAAGRIQIKDEAGTVMSAEVVRQRVLAAQAKALEIGDEAAARIEQRHAGDAS